MRSSSLDADGASSSSAGEMDLVVRSAECVSDHGKAACAQLGGECVTEQDGYYAVSAVCIVAGAVLLYTFVGPVARKLQCASSRTLLPFPPSLARAPSRRSLLACILSSTTLTTLSLLCATALPASAWRVKKARL